MNEIFESIDALKSGIDMCLERISSLEGRQSDIERIFFDDIINPAKEAIDKQLHMNEVDGFRAEHGAKFEPYVEPLRAIEADPEFDIVETAYDSYMELPEPRPEAAEFVDEMVVQIVEQIEDVKAKLGITGDITATVTEEGEVEVKTEDGEVVAETDENGEIVVNEEVVDGDENVEEEEIVVDEETGEPIDDPAEVEAFEKELDAMLDRK